MLVCAGQAGLVPMSARYSEYCIFSAGQRELAAGLVLGREMEESQMVFLFLVDTAFISVFCSNTVQRGLSLRVVMEGLRT